MDLTKNQRLQLKIFKFKQILAVDELKCSIKFALIEILITESQLKHINTN